MCQPATEAYTAMRKVRPSASVFIFRILNDSSLEKLTINITIPYYYEWSASYSNTYETKFDRNHSSGSTVSALSSIHKWKIHNTYIQQSNHSLFIDFNHLQSYIYLIGWKFKMSQHTTQTSTPTAANGASNETFIRYNGAYLHTISGYLKIACLVNS